MYVVDNLINDPHWFIVNVRMRLTTFLPRFKSVSEYYRRICHSKSRVLGKTNRDFFQKIEEGFYRSETKEDEIYIFFYFRFKELKNIYKDLKELSIRIKKVQFCYVVINEIWRMTLTDKILLETKGGFNFFQKIRKSYSLACR